MTVKQREEMRVPGLPAPLSHYTDAVRFGDLLFVSGCAPLDENDRLVGEDDVVAQARQVLVNLGKALQHAGANFGDVLKVTVYLLDVGTRTAVNEVRKEFFGDAFPASTLVEVSRLAVPGMLVEIEAVAGLRG
ncbi:MAG: Endoribonuclease [Actinoallomurus sp.]|jgi:2-iminobutanoate/2-iminopropanoate deaminase|nr:Endoribonuclease [Actinoallomurus sp.]